MGVTLVTRYALEDASQVAEVRRAAEQRADALGFDPVVRGRAAIVATELATNVLRHAGRGEVLLADARGQLLLIATDRGPGMGSVSRALHDGFSTRGGAGTGLGAVRRLSTRFDVHSHAGRGTVVLAVVADVAQTTPVADGLVAALPPEQVSGDAWAAVRDGDVVTVALVDGLGHGPEAARAASTALRHLAPGPSPEALLRRMHDAMRSTRGAAGAVAALDVRTGALRFAGVGNIAAVLAGGGRQASLSSHNGTLGHRVTKLQGTEHQLAAGDTLVLHSDGCRAGWAFADHPGLGLRDPLVVAAVVLRDTERGTDDASVVVVRREAAA